MSTASPAELASSDDMRGGTRVVLFSGLQQRSGAAARRSGETAVRWLAACLARLGDWRLARRSSSRRLGQALAQTSQNWKVVCNVGAWLALSASC
eukprot:scaffold1908_cov104-Isochrysis_galbana.AAC.5